jgi:hypothetical protein
MAGEMPPIVHGEPDDGDGFDDNLDRVFEVAQPVAGADQLADLLDRQVDRQSGLTTSADLKAAEAFPHVAFRDDQRRASFWGDLRWAWRRRAERKRARVDVARALGLPSSAVRTARGSRVDWADYLAGSGVAAGVAAITDPSDVVLGAGAALMVTSAVLIAALQDRGSRS